MDKITGADLIHHGLTPGKDFGDIIREGNKAISAGFPKDKVLKALVNTMRRLEDERAERRVRMREHPLPYACFTPSGPSEDEAKNYAQVNKDMAEITRTPVVQAAALMPDACPVGNGNIPVGGVVSSTMLHPGFHSADVCCSVMATEFEDADPRELLDVVHQSTHFGPGGHKPPRYRMSQGLVIAMTGNRFLRDLVDLGHEHLGTQGDGNHFSFVGKNQEGNTVLVTHHGSRGVGAKLYKQGMAIAEKLRREVCPELPAHCAWIDPKSRDGEDYWEALQIVERWTQENHLAIHEQARERFNELNTVFNAHNFIFKREDGLYYHAKGATPAYKIGKPALVPLNMAEPVMVIYGSNNPEALGFAPHGAGRLVSRGEHIRRGGGNLEAETAGLDVRFFCGEPDMSELPSAYKDAETVRQEMISNKLANVADQITPYGCIMAGDFNKNAPWRKASKAKKTTQNEGNTNA